MFEIIQILDKKRKQKFYLMTFFLLAGMLLDVFSLALLLPLIELILGNNTNFLTEQVYAISKTFFEGRVLLPFSIFVILIYSFKAIYSIYLSYRQNRFISNLIRDTSNKLFSFYLQQNYSYHVQTNSAEVIRNLNSDLFHFSTYLRSIMFLYTEIGFVLSTLTLLIFLNPLVSTGTILFFVVIIFIYYTNFKNKLNSLGDKKQKVALEYNKIILETSSSIKEIKVNQKEHFFHNLLAKETKNLWDIDSTLNTFLQTPRYVLELISILAIFVLLFFINVGEGIETDFYSFLGVFIASVFKLIPSANKILNSLQNIKFSNSAIFSVKSKIKNQTKNAEIFEVKNFDTLELKNISFSYKKNEKVLKDINIKIEKGDFIGIKGESGSGKTTLIDIILGLQQPEIGEIKINGKSNVSFKKGYVPQNSSILDISIRDNVAFGIKREDQDFEQIIKSLEKAEILSFVNQKEQGLDFMVGENGGKLSGGQKQRLGLARALYSKPDLLILDEPTSALDSETENAILKTFKNLSGEITIILISHNESVLKVCDNTYQIQNKNLIQC